MCRYLHRLFLLYEKNRHSYTSNDRLTRSSLFVVLSVGVLFSFILIQGQHVPVRTMSSSSHQQQQSYSTTQSSPQQTQQHQDQLQQYYSQLTPGMY